jgi:hypothetical protein
MEWLAWEGASRVVGSRPRRGAKRSLKAQPPKMFQKLLLADSFGTHDRFNFISARSRFVLPVGLFVVIMTSMSASKQACCFPFFGAVRSAPNNLQENFAPQNFVA